MKFALSMDGQRVVEAVNFVNLAVAPDAANTQSSRMVAAGLSQQNGELLRELVGLTRGSTRLSITFRFHAAETQLDNRAQHDLDRLARFMQTSEAQGKELMVLGFSDNRGDYSINLRLSQRRAEAVAEGLRARGVKVAVVKGMGEEAPVACNTNDIGAARNRHVEAWLR